MFFSCPGRARVGPEGALHPHMERHIEWQWTALQTAERRKSPGRSRRRRSTHSRRWIIALAGVVAGICLATLVGRNALESHIRNNVLPSLSDRFDRTIEARDIVFGLGTATLRDITIGEPHEGTPLAVIREAKVSVDLSSLLRGDVVVDHIAFVGVTGDVVVGGADDNISDILQQLSGRANESTAQTNEGGRGRVSGATVSASNVALSVAHRATGSTSQLSAANVNVDAERTVTMTGVDISARTIREGQVASVELVSATVVATRDGAVSLNAGGMRTGSSDPRMHTMLADSSVGLLYVERVRGQRGDWEWHAMGKFDSARELAPKDDTAESFLVSVSSPVAGAHEVRVQGKNLKLARFAPLLASYPQLALEQAIASVEWTVHANDAGLSVDGETHLDGLQLTHSRLSKDPVHIDDTVLRGRAAFDRRTGAFRIDDAVVVSGAVPYELSVGVLLPDYERADHPASQVIAQVSMPTVGCQEMLASLPKGFAPQLEGFELSGTAEGRLAVFIDWDNLDATELNSDLDFDNCHVVRAPHHMSAERLTGSFQHRVPVPGGWRTFLVGPQNPSYVPLRNVSKNLTRSFLTTEDSAFYRHRGFITKEFQSALVKNLERGRFAYGASSISMQVVKNVLLSREKTVSRKVQELFLTWHMEAMLSKDRILEIYVNAIEFGPGLYGIGPAARQYFGKHPRNLNPVESAFLSSLLPAPTRRFRQYCRGRIGRTTSAKIARILGHMHKRHRLDEEAHALALETPLAFRGRKRALCKQTKPRKKGKTS